MPTYESISDLKDSLVRKALKGSLFVAPEDATPITIDNLFTVERAVADAVTTSGDATLTSASGAFTASDVGADLTGTGIPVGTKILSVTNTTTVEMTANATATASGVSVTITPIPSLNALPTGYEDGGLTTDEGLRFSRSTETSVITSWQRTTPTRSDKTSDSETLAVDFQELKKTTLGVYSGADLSAAEVSATGALSIRKPAVPNDPHFRLLAIAVDIVDGEELVVARFYPRAKAESYSDQVWAKGDNAINWGMTFQTYVDDALGYSKDDMFGGPGFLALAADMGFGVAS